MILQNKRLIYQTPGTFLGGLLHLSQNDFEKRHQGIFSGSTWDKKNGLPTGTESSFSYLLPIKAGAMVSQTQTQGMSGVTLHLLQGINMQGDIVSFSELQGSLSQIIQLISTAIGTGVLSGGISGAISLGGSSQGVGSLVALLGLLSDLQGVLSGTVTSLADLRGKSTLAGIITPFTELSPEGLATAIWNSIAANYNTPGTMGYLLNNVQSGGGNIDLSQIEPLLNEINDWAKISASQKLQKK